MSKIRIRYDGKYYEYDDKELNITLYHDDTDEQLVSLFEKRARYIKDFNMAAEVLKYKKKADIKCFKEKCDRSLQDIYEIEKEIAAVQEKLNCTLDWYSPTDPCNSDDVPELEEQRAYICCHCGYTLDNGYTYTSEDYGISTEEFCKNKCPNCKEEDSFFYRNKYLIQAEKYLDEANQLSQDTQFSKIIELYKEAYCVLEKVNRNDESDYLFSLYDRAMVKQTLARTYISKEFYKEAFVCINEAIRLWDTAMENNAAYDLNLVAMAYNLRQNCCLALRTNLDSVVEDGHKALKLLSRYKQLAEVTRADKGAQFYEKCLNEYEGISMLIYIAMCEAAHILNKPQEEKDNMYQKGRQFLNQCTHFDADERSYFNQQLAVYKNTPTSSSTKKEGCYIATAVYGSYNAEPVLVLRSFRDNVLKNSLAGRLFIKFYYRYSPALAEKLKERSFINRCIRRMLDTFVNHLRKKGSIS